MKPRSILLLVFLIFACVLGCMLGSFGVGISIPIDGQPVTFKAFIPPISVPAELVAQPMVEILGMQVGLYNTLFTTLVVDAVIVVLALLGRRGLSRSASQVPKSWFANAWEGYVELLYNRFIVPSLGSRAIAVLPLCVTVFTFIMIAGFFELVPGHESVGRLEQVTQGGYCAVDVGGVTLITGVPVKTSVAEDCAPAHSSSIATESGGAVVVPFLRRATSDLSTTLALALIAFFFIEFQGIRANGWFYFERFFRIGALRKPGSGMTGLINYIQFGVGFLELLSEFIRIISFSFRLFGNMFAGTILVFVMAFILPFAMPTVFLALEFAIAIIQAFVFMMLVVVFTSLAVSH
jgi:F-type H+-transporting ATPase subunit a